MIKINIFLSDLSDQRDAIAGKELFANTTVFVLSPLHLDHLENLPGCINEAIYQAIYLILMNF